MMKKDLYFGKAAAVLVSLLLPTAAFLAGQPVLARYETAHCETLELVRTAEYIIRFDGNFGNDPASPGGYGSMADLTAVRGTVQVLPANVFVKTGDGSPSYVFSGWNTEADGSGTAYAEQAEVLDAAGAWETVILYAQWAESRGPALSMAGPPEENGTEGEPERTDPRCRDPEEEDPENGDPAGEDPENGVAEGDGSESGSAEGNSPETGEGTDPPGEAVPEGANTSGEAGPEGADIPGETDSGGEPPEEGSPEQPRNEEEPAVSDTETNGPEVPEEP